MVRTCTLILDNCPHRGSPYIRILQVEYAYPSLVAGQPVDSSELPTVWKNLPSLALPDGAHNHDKGTYLLSNHA